MKKPVDDNYSHGDHNSSIGSGRRCGYRLDYGAVMHRKRFL